MALLTACRDPCLISDTRNRRLIGEVVSYAFLLAEVLSLSSFFIMSRKAHHKHTVKNPYVQRTASYVRVVTSAR